MPNARQVKQRIGTANNIAKITKAMEMVSASKMRRAQEQTLSARPFAQALQESLQKLADEALPDLHPLLSRHDEGSDVMILLSTDKGLCGSLNQNLFKAFLDWRAAHPKGKILVIGKKGVNFTRFLGVEAAAQFTDLPDPISLPDVLPISSLIMQNFIERKYRSVSIIFMDFINTLSQKTKLTQILPVQAVEVAADEVAPDVTAEANEYTFEPSAKEILSELLPYFVENAVYQAFLESRASEHSARMVAMKNASDNAKDLVKELKLIYNKSRQEAITSELLDITTAQLSLTA